MTTALRVGFLVSGVVHMAVVAAFSLSPQPERLGEDRGSPITLTLSTFEPAPVAPMVPSTPPEPLPELVVAEPPAEPVIAEQKDSPSADEQAMRTLKPAAEKPSRPKRSVEPKRVAASRETVRKKTLSSRAKPAGMPPATTTVVAKAETTRPVVSKIDERAGQHYLAALAARINDNKFYPRTSRRLGEEGMVVVGFTIQRNGELTDIVIVESSGHRRLDEAALKTVKRVTPFQAIPDTVDHDHWSITVPIAFTLRS